MQSPHRASHCQWLSLWWPIASTVTSPYRAQLGLGINSRPTLPGKISSTVERHHFFSLLKRVETLEAHFNQDSWIRPTVDRMRGRDGRDGRREPQRGARPVCCRKSRLSIWTTTSAFWSPEAAGKSTEVL